MLLVPKKTNFEQAYWDKLYKEPETMDGIGNVAEHVRYIKTVFELDLIDISSIIDFGFGHGILFKKLLKTYLPYRACGIEPSLTMYEKALKKKIAPVSSMKLDLYHEDLKTWCLTDRKKKARFDLGICMSVFQYISGSELKEIIPILSQRVKYLYLTVPTKEELEKQVDDLAFFDPFAKRRSRKFYYNLLKPHFTFISSRILESKHYFNEETSLFSDLMYRF